MSHKVDRAARQRCGAWHLPEAGPAIRGRGDRKTLLSHYDEFGVLPEEPAPAGEVVRMMFCYSWSPGAVRVLPGVNSESVHASGQGFY